MFLNINATGITILEAKNKIKNIYIDSIIEFARLGLKTEYTVIFICY